VKSRPPDDIAAGKFIRPGFGDHCRGPHQSPIRLSYHESKSMRDIRRGGGGERVTGVLVDYEAATHVRPETRSLGPAERISVVVIASSARLYYRRPYHACEGCTSPAYTISIIPVSRSSRSTGIPARAISLSLSLSRKKEKRERGNIADTGVTLSFEISRARSR